MKTEPDSTHEHGKKSISLVSPDDVALFILVVQARDADEWASLQTIAERVGCSVSSIYQCLLRLEERYDGTLIVRKPRQGMGELTTLGRQCFAAFQQALENWKLLNSPADYVSPDGKKIVTQPSITIATTNSLHLQLLPGAEGAHIVRMRREWDALQQQWENIDPTRRPPLRPFPPTRIRVQEGNYPELVAGVLNGQFDFAIGWELQGDPYEDLRQETLLAKEVQFGLVISSQQVREVTMTGQDLLGQLFANNGESVRADGHLVKAFNGRTIALMKSEYNPAISRVLTQTPLTHQILVNTYEDVLAAVRIGWADAGCVPEFYRNRPVVEYRQLVDEKHRPIGRYVMTYSRKNQPWPPNSDTELGREVGKLLETLKEFVNDEANLQRTLARKVDGSSQPRIPPEYVRKWADKQWETVWKQKFKKQMERENAKTK